MLRAFSSTARLDITVNIVVPTSGSLLMNRTSALQVFQSAGERTDREAALAQRLRRGQAALAGGAYQQRLAAGGKQPRIRQEFLHGDMPGAGGTDGHFLGGSNIDDLEPALGGGGQ